MEPNRREGFEHDGRRIYSIRYTLESPPPTICEVIVPLDSDGNSLNGLAQPVDPSRRIVQVQPGEQIKFKKEIFRVLAVDAYSFSWIDGRQQGSAKGDHCGRLKGYQLNP